MHKSSLYNDNRILYMTPDGEVHGCEAGLLEPDGKILDEARQLRKCMGCDQANCTFNLYIDGLSQNRHNLNAKTSLTPGQITGLKGQRDHARFFLITIVSTGVPEPKTNP